MSDPTRDPIHQLENFSEGLTVNPLSPSEVRRRGDRLRRRNAVTGAVAAAAVVAVMATPFVLLNHGDAKTDPGPTTNGPTPTEATTLPSSSPSATPGDDPTGPRVAEIPDDFPLIAGWPDPSQSEYGDKALKGPSRDLAALEITACGSQVPDPGNLDRLDATWTNAEDYRARELLTFSTAQEAVTYVAHLRALWQECQSEETGDGGQVHELRTTQVGGESVALLTGYTYQGGPTVGLSIDHVVRLGRAVLIDATSNEGTLEAADDQIAGMTQDSADVVAAMCLYTEAGCGGDPSDGSADQVLSLDGYGDLRLGMTATEVEGTGLASLHPFTDPAMNCQTMSIDGWGDTVHPNFSGNVHGLVSKKYGLAIIIAQPGMHTPEGIGVGSTVEEVRAAYGELSGSDAYNTTPVNGASYFFLTDGRVVNAFQVELADEDCIGVD